MEEMYANKLMGTAQAQCASDIKGSIGRYMPPTQRQQLEEKKAILLSELKRVQDALEALDAHPDLEKFHQTLQAALR